MRLRYSLTSDIEDVPKYVKQQLESYAGKVDLNSKIHKIIYELGEKRINFVGLGQEVLWLRQNLAILDQLLAESGDIIKACQKAEGGEIELPPSAEQVPPEPSSTKEAMPENTPTAVNDEDAALAGIQDSFSQLTAMAKTFKEMKDTNKEKYST